MTEELYKNENLRLRRKVKILERLCAAALGVAVGLALLMCIS